MFENGEKKEMHETKTETLKWMERNKKKETRAREGGEKKEKEE